jgi:gliding motility-associated-like protein
MPLDNGFGTPSSVSIINCGHTNNSGNVYSTSDSSCISVVRSTTVGYNLDTLCVVVCNTAGICDTTQVIVSNVPGTDTLPVRDSIVICIKTEPRDSNVIIKACDGTTSTVTVLGSYTIDSATQCIKYTAGNIIGSDTLCVVKCDTATGKCDTFHPVVVITPRIDTIRDTNTVGTTATVCMPLEGGFGTPSNVSIINCGHANNSGNVYSISGTSCITIVRSETVGYNLDTLCVVVCNARGVCDTTTVIVSNEPKADTTKDTIRTTQPIRTNDTICNFVPSDTTGVIVTSCDGGVFGTTIYNGTWTIDSNKCLVYTAGSIKLNDTICIQVCKGDTCKQTIVIITVTGLPPVAVDDSVVTEVNTPVRIPVLPNDTTYDEDPLMLCGDGAIVTDPVHGSVIVNADGTVTYTPVTGYVGVDSFQYQICDPEGRDTAWVYIRIIGVCEIPNAITPNGDGINDVFVIPCATGDIEFSVWNRWGIEVYRSDKYLNDWDGRYKGSPLPDGTYYYVVKYRTTNGDEINKAGFITIHR